MSLYKYKDDKERYFDSVCSTHSDRGFTYNNEIRQKLHRALIVDLKLKYNLLFNNTDMSFFYFGKGDNPVVVIGYDADKKWIKIFRNFSINILRLIVDFYETVEEL